MELFSQGFTDLDMDHMTVDVTIVLKSGLCVFGFSYLKLIFGEKYNYMNQKKNQGRCISVFSL